MVAILLQLSAIMVDMKNIAAILALLLLPAFALGQTGAYSGHTFVGGVPATTSGMNSSNYLDGIIPGASITVYLTGTSTKATIYADGNNTRLSNPFFSNLASGTNPGGFIFWSATNQGLDIQAQGGMGNASCTTSPLCYPTATTLQVDVYPNSSILPGCLGGNTIANGCTGANNAAGANLNITGVTQTGALGASSQVSTFPGTVAAQTIATTSNNAGTGTTSTSDISDTMNGINPQTVFRAAQGGGDFLSSITGAALAPSGATIHQMDGVTGIVLNEASGAGTAANSVGVYGQCTAAANNAWCWGANTLASSNSGYTGAHITAYEADLNINNTTDSGLGISVNGYWGAIPSSPPNGFSLSAPGGVSGGKWGSAFISGTGAATYGLSLFPQATTASSNSQTILLQDSDSSNVQHPSYIFSDPSGNIDVNAYSSFNVNTPSLQTSSSGAPVNTVQNNYVGTYAPVDAELAPSATAGVQHFMGTGESTNNAIVEQFNVVGAGSTSNSFTVGLYGNSHTLEVDGLGDFKLSGNTIIPPTVTSYHGNTSGTQIPLATNWTATAGALLCDDGNGNLTITGCNSSGGSVSSIGTAYPYTVPALPGSDAIGSYTPYVDIRAWGAVMDGATPINTALATAMGKCLPFSGGFGSCNTLIAGLAGGAYLAPTSTSITSTGGTAETDIQGKLILNSTLILSNGTIKGKCGGQGGNFVNKGCPATIVGPQVYGVLGTGVDSGNTLVAVVPTFTEGSFANLPVGSAITISDTVSVTASVTLTEGNGSADFYTATLAARTEIPLLSVIQVTGCANAAFDTYANGASVYWVDWPNQKMSWYGPAGTAGSTTGCTITGQDYSTFESVDIVGSNGTGTGPSGTCGAGQLCFTPAHAHSLSTWGEVAIKNPVGNFAHAALVDLTVIGCQGACLWGEDSTGLYLDGVTLAPSQGPPYRPSMIAEEASSTAYQGAFITNSELDAATNFLPYCGTIASGTGTCYQGTFPGTLLCDYLPSNAPGGGGGNGCPNIISNTNLNGGPIYTRGNGGYVPTAIPNMINVTEEHSAGCGVIFDSSNSTPLWTGATWTTPGLEDPSGNGMGPNNSAAWACATDPYPFSANVFNVIGGVAAEPQALGNTYFSNASESDSTTIMSYGHGLPAYPPAPQGITKDGKAWIGELRSIGSGLGPQLIPYPTLPIAATPTIQPSGYATAATVEGPDGQLSATQYTSISNSGGYIVTAQTGGSIQTYAGDWFIYGSWERATGQTALTTGPCSTSAVGSYFGDVYVQNSGDYDMNLWGDEWHPHVNIAAVTTGTSTPHFIDLYMFEGCASGQQLQIYQPFWMQIPGPNNPAYAGVTEDEVERWRRDLMHGSVPSGTSGFSHAGVTASNLPISVPSYFVLNPTTGVDHGLSTGDLTDWTNTGITNGAVPVWNSTTSKWTPGTGYNGTCAPTTTLTVVNGIITGCS
jgi:hypothetical protein